MPSPLESTKFLSSDGPTGPIKAYNNGHIVSAK